MLQHNVKQMKGLKSRVENDASIFNETRMMSNTLDHIEKDEPLSQDLINIQVQRYQNGGLSSCYIPTSAGFSAMYDYRTPPLNVGVSSISVSYGY